MEINDSSSPIVSVSRNMPSKSNCMTHYLISEMNDSFVHDQ
jgi:hypothetical protein